VRITVKPFKITPHTSEVGLEAVGRDLPELFRNAAGGLFLLWAISPLPASPRKRGEGKFPIKLPLPVYGERTAARPGEGLKEIRIQLAGEDPGDLLILWLNELAFLVQTERLRPAEIRIDSLSDKALSATLQTIPAPAGRDLAVEIKSATRAGKLVEKTKDGWSAKVILDI
jgi:SHS2 domain-containing protein